MKKGKGLKGYFFIIIVLLIIISIIVFTIINEPQKKCCSKDFGEFYECWINLKCTQRSCYRNESKTLYGVMCKPTQ